MKSTVSKICILIVFLFLSAFSIRAQLNIFTYQGSLKSGGAAVSGTYDFEFDICLLPTGGEVLTTIAQNNVQVTNGIFKVDLPAPGVWQGGLRYLQIRVWQSGASNWDSLTPRQLTTSAPYAIKADRAETSAQSEYASTANTANLATSATNAQTAQTALTANSAINFTGVVQIANGGTGSSTKNFVDLSTNQTVGGNKTFTGTLNGDGSGLTNINGSNITNSSISASALAPDVFPERQKLALLAQNRWDKLIQRITVGTSPSGVIFDGTNLWTANRGSGNVTKVRASDGAVLGTYAVGTFPLYITFDGSNIWVVNAQSQNLTKLRARDGANLGTIAVSELPTGIIFDGVYIYVSDFYLNASKIRASDSTNFGTVAIGGARYLTFDGANLWVVQNNLRKYRVTDAVGRGNFEFINGEIPGGILFDGESLWVTFNDGTFINRYRATDGNYLGTYYVGNQPNGIAFDGNYIWVTARGDNALVKTPIFKP